MVYPFAQAEQQGHEILGRTSGITAGIAVDHPEGVQTGPIPEEFLAIVEDVVQPFGIAGIHPLGAAEAAFEEGDGVFPVGDLVRRVAGPEFHAEIAPRIVAEAQEGIKTFLRKIGQRRFHDADAGCDHLHVVAEACEQFEEQAMFVLAPSPRRPGVGVAVEEVGVDAPQRNLR